jgi:hypothetical protein
MDIPAGSTAFPGFQNASIDFERSNNQIFRNLSLVLTGDQVLLLLKAVRAVPQDQIFSSIDEHRRNSKRIPASEKQKRRTLTVQLPRVLHPSNFPSSQNVLRNPWQQAQPSTLCSRKGSANDMTV